MTDYKLVQGEPVAFCEDAALSIAERTFSTEVDEQLASDIIQYAQRLHSLYAAPQPAEQQPDDAAVDRFASAMKSKLAKKRSEGRTGWQEANSVYLSELLREHVEKGDPVDVGNLAMMIHENGFSIEKKPVRWATVSDCAEQTPDVEKLIEALENAARSLRTISKKAGIDEFMSEMCEVRGYAESRAWCAEKDLAAFEAVRQGCEA